MKLKNKKNSIGISIDIRWHVKLWKKNSIGDLKLK